MWYAAHAVMLFRLKEGEQTEFPIWENIFLIEAATPEETHQKAEARARWKMRVQKIIRIFGMVDHFDLSSWD